MQELLKITWSADLQPMTLYEVTITTAVTDTFGQPIPAPLVFTFTTGA